MRIVNSLLLVVFHAFASTAVAEPKTADSAGTQGAVDVAVTCEQFSEFKKYNTVLCAYVAQLTEAHEKVMVPRYLACAYPSIRKDLSLCPEQEVATMGLPDLPYLLDTPTWPVNMKPVLTTVNGKALNEVLKMHEALFSNQYDVSKYCVSKDGDLQKNDRILCGPFVENLNLVDAAKMPSHDMNILVAFASGSTAVDTDSQWMLDRAVVDALSQYKATVEALHIPFNIAKVKPTRIKIVGRADANGNADTNRSYSEQRADSTATAVRSVLNGMGVAIPENALIIDWVGSDESYCSEEYGTAVCRTEDAYGNFVSGRTGWRVASGANDRCYNDEYGRNGWHHPIKKVCDASDRSSRVEIHFEFELVDLKDAEIKKLRARLEELKALQQKQKPLTIHQR